MTKEFDKRNAAKSRKVCEAMAEAASTGKRVLSEREREILDMWPRFEDGEPVMVGDEATSNKNRRFTVKRIEFMHGKWMLNDSRTEGHYRNGKSCERMNRPALKMRDADGVEINVGDKVWLLNGIDNELVVEEIDDESGWVGTRSANGGCLSVYNTHLTHTRPDSWERLEEDASKDTCVYFGGTGHFDCSECSSGGVNCFRRMKLDIIRRAKALAGVEVD